MMSKVAVIDSQTFNMQRLESVIDLNFRSGIETKINLSQMNHSFFQTFLVPLNQIMK